MLTEFVAFCNCCDDDAERETTRKEERGEDAADVQTAIVYIIIATTLSNVSPFDQNAVLRSGGRRSFLRPLPA